MSGKRASTSRKLNSETVGSCMNCAAADDGARGQTQTVLRDVDDDGVLPEEIHSKNGLCHLCHTKGMASREVLKLKFDSFFFQKYQ